MLFVGVVYIFVYTNGDTIVKFLSVRELRSESAKVWKELADEREMVITSNGRPIAILASVDEDSVEESLRAFRRARAIEAALQLQGASLEAGRDATTMDEIAAEIAAVRAGRHR